jgi:hypothetical protein
MGVTHSMTKTKAKTTTEAGILALNLNVVAQPSGVRIIILDSEMGKVVYFQEIEREQINCRPAAYRSLIGNLAFISLGGINNTATKIQICAEEALHAFYNGSN